MSCGRKPWGDEVSRYTTSPGCSVAGAAVHLNYHCVQIAPGPGLMRLAVKVTSHQDMRLGHRLRQAVALDRKQDIASVELQASVVRDMVAPKDPQSSDPEAPA